MICSLEIYAQIAPPVSFLFPGIRISFLNCSQFVQCVSSAALGKFHNYRSSQTCKRYILKHHPNDIMGLILARLSRQTLEINDHTRIELTVESEPVNQFFYHIKEK